MLTTILVERTDGGLSSHSTSSSLPVGLQSLPASNMHSLDCRHRRSSGLFSCAVAIGQKEPMNDSLRLAKGNVCGRSPWGEPQMDRVQIRYA